MELNSDLNSLGWNRFNRETEGDAGVVLKDEMEAEAEEHVRFGRAALLL